MWKTWDFMMLVFLHYTGQFIHALRYLSRKSQFKSNISLPNLRVVTKKSTCTLNFIAAAAIAYRTDYCKGTHIIFYGWRIPTRDFLACRKGKNKYKKTEFSVFFLVGPYSSRSEDSSTIEYSASALRKNIDCMVTKENSKTCPFSLF